MRFKRLLISAGSKGKFIVMFVHEKLLGATNIKNVNPCKKKKKKQVTHMQLNPHHIHHVRGGQQQLMRLSCIDGRIWF